MEESEIGTKSCLECRHSSDIWDVFCGLGKPVRRTIICNELNSEIEEADWERDCCRYETHKVIFYGFAERSGDRHTIRLNERKES